MAECSAEHLKKPGRLAPGCRILLWLYPGKDRLGLVEAVLALPVFVNRGDRQQLTEPDKGQAQCGMEGEFWCDWDFQCLWLWGNVAPGRRAPEEGREQCSKEDHGGHKMGRPS